MKRSAEGISPYIPYLAVALGMYGARNAWAALFLYHAGMLATIALAKGERAANGKSRLKPSWLPLITVVFAMGGVLLYALWPLLGRDGGIVADRLAVFGVTARNWPFLALYFCLANASIEELFWRGSLGSDTRLITSNDMFFAGYHSFVMVAFANPIWAVPVFVACVFGGWMWRWLRSISGGLLLPILTHIAADASIAIAVSARAFR